MLLGYVSLGHPFMGVPSCWARDVNVQGSEKQEDAEFSARIVRRVQGKRSQAQVFVKGNRYRIEPFGGVQTSFGLASVTIVRKDRGKVWHVISQRRLVVEVPFTRENWLPLSVHLNGEISRTLIGDSLIGEQTMTLYEIEVEQFETRERFYQWVDPERKVLRKLVSLDRDWSVEFEHIVQSNQPDYFFNPPLGYRIIELPESEGEVE